MSDNEEHNQQGSQDARPVVDGFNADNSNMVLPLDLNLDLDLISSSSTPQRMSGLEWLSDTLTDDVVEANSILVPKGRCNTPGNRDYNQNLDLAMSPLDPKIGVPSHFISNRDGKTESGNQTKHQFIQEVFVSNFNKVDQAML